MTYAEADALLKRVTYKPNVRLVWGMGPTGWYDAQAWRSGDSETLQIGVLANVLDVETRSHHVDITLSITISLKGLDPKGLLFIIRKTIANLEEHEVDEFFQVDGLQPFGPHDSDEKKEATWTDILSGRSNPEVKKPLSSELIFDEHLSYKSDAIDALSYLMVPESPIEFEYRTMHYVTLIGLKE